MEASRASGYTPIDLLIAEHERHPDSPLLFPSPKTDSHLDPPAVARKLKTLLKRAGMYEIRFHADADRCRREDRWVHGENLKIYIMAKTE